MAMRDWGYNLSCNPVSKIRKPTPGKPRSRRLEGDEEDRLLAALSGCSNPWVAPLVSFAIETGMRRSEMLNLTWQHVQLDKRFVHLADTKNGDSRNVPLSSKAIAILQSIPRHISGRVFPIHFEALKSLWRRATLRAGLDDLHFHDLRHEATSRLFEHGLNVMEVASITGHKDLRMLQRYTHLRAEDLAKKLA
ncbi:site-specific integrase [Candidatus Dojkabacteria bacterium]|nr:site-specific integrase [Candidatus Dojkabacteria bacterium]